MTTGRERKKEEKKIGITGSHFMKEQCLKTCIAALPMFLHGNFHAVCVQYVCRMSFGGSQKHTEVFLENGKRMSCLVADVHVHVVPSSCSV